MNEAPVALGRYLLHEAIGGGGMAHVHLGRVRGAAGFSRLVAIKRLHRSHARDPEFSKMLADEARLVSRIRHPNVVPVLDVVQVDGELLLVMEYVHGVSLSKLAELSPSRRLPEPIATRVVLDVLRGLAAAHDAKSERGRELMLVHRDVSPHNILVGTDGVARLVDFGIAKAEGKLAVTRDGQIKGKLSYMAPEQLRGEDVDRRTDIYCAGIVLWELATGERLFQRTLKDVAAKNTDALVVPPPSARDGVTSVFDEVVSCALQSDREARYPNADAMAEALDRACVAATAKEVSAFVTELAGGELERRDSLVARLEETSDVYEVEPAPAAPAPRPRRWPLAVGALVVAGGVLWLIRSRHDASAPTAAPPVVVTSVVSEPPEAPSPPETPMPIASIAPKPNKVHVAGRRAPPTASASPDCDPPFSIDARGIRIPRRECLQR